MSKSKWTKLGTSHPKVRKLFREYNRQYFSGKLPPRTRILMALNWPLNHWGRCYCDGGKFLIVINNKLCKFDKIFRWAMLHEMAHIPTMTECGEHGRQFKLEMRRLAKAGAFDSIW